MANFNFNHRRLNEILRLAPWVDFNELRTEMIRRVKNYDTANVNGWASSIASYEAGEVPTLPRSYSIQDMVYEAMLKLYPDYSETDARYFDAVECLKRYFTNADYWREATTDEAPA